MEKRFLDNEKDVTVLSEIVMDWVPNLWTPYQPLVNLATGKEAPTEMVDNVKYIKQRGEKAMNEFISRFTFNEGSPTQKTYYDSTIKVKSHSFTADRNKKNSTVAEEENKSFCRILSCYDNPTMSLHHIMNLPITKSLFRYSETTVGLIYSEQEIQVLQQTTVFESCGSPPTYITTSIVSAMKVV